MPGTTGGEAVPGSIDQSSAVRRLTRVGSPKEGNASIPDRTRNGDPVGLWGMGIDKL